MNFDFCGVQPAWWRRVLLVFAVVPFYLLGMLICIVFGIIETCREMLDATLDYPEAIREVWHGEGGGVI